MHKLHSHSLGKFLVEEGVLPPNSMDASLVIDVDGILHVNVDIAVDEDDLPKIARALTKMHEEIKNAR
jgi:hypothetical protein